MRGCGSEPGALALPTPAGADRAADRAPPRPDRAGDLVWAAPGWVIPVGAVLWSALLTTSFLLFWRVMGTAARQSAVEACGVGLGVLVLLSAIGAGRQAVLQDRAGTAGTPAGSGPQPCPDR